MTDPKSPSALREWRDFVSHPQTLVSLGAVCTVLAIVGPFETAERLSLPERGAYWLILVCASFGFGAWVNVVVAARAPGLSTWLKIALTGLIGGAGVTLIVLALNYASFGWWPAPEALPGLIGTILAIALIINTAIALLLGQSKDPQSAAPRESATGGPPPLLERLPFDKRGPLVSLTVEDHYVRIRTARGEALVLLRLSDALRETGDTPGAQVHRSHWAAWDQVREVIRRGDGALLKMAHGPDIPVSRTKMAALRAAGLLPR